MIPYDKNYDVLFNNEKFVNVLCKFYSSHWENCNIGERIDIIKEFVSIYCEAFKINNLKVKMVETSHSGTYMDYKTMVNVNKDAVINGNQYDVMDTLFHELRHNFQHRAIAGNIDSEIEKVDENIVKEWKLNFKSSPTGYHNYISTKGEKSYLYYYQPVEADAFRTGLSLTRKAYSIISKIKGEDVEFKEYGKMYRDYIMTYFSKEEEFVAIFEKYRKEIFEIYDENNEKFKLEKECLNKAKVLMEKAIEDMTLEEVCSLFSVYVWAYLEDDYKINLIKEYDKRVNKHKPVKIEKVGNSTFRIDGVIHDRSQVASILNTLFSYEFRKKVEAIINGKESCSANLKEELEVNMYEHNGKKINYIADSDNFTMYSIQPYALYEGKVVVEQFKKVKECEANFYGVNGESFENMIDFYDYDKYIPYIEEFFEKPFKEIYDGLVKKMKEKINKINNKR